MNKLLLLLRVQFLNLPGLNPRLYRGSPRAQRKAVLTALGACFVLAALLGTSAMYSVMLAYALKPLGALDQLPVLMMFVASIVVLITAVYKSVNLLFTFRDYDTLAALPVPAFVLLGSRFLMLYLSNLGFMALILAPALAVYGVMAAPGAGFWAAAAVSFFFVPLLPVLAGTLLGLVISLAASRFRHSNALTILFSLAAFALLMVGIMGLNASMSSDTFGPAAQIAAGAITRAVLPGPSLSASVGRPWLVFGAVCAGLRHTVGAGCLASGPALRRAAVASHGAPDPKRIPPGGAQSPLAGHGAIRQGNAPLLFQRPLCAQRWRRPFVDDPNHHRAGGDGR